MSFKLSATLQVCNPAGLTKLRDFPARFHNRCGMLSITPMFSGLLASDLL